jgi:hypothetical protein
MSGVTYTYQVPKEFMSEIREYQKLTLGETEAYFLYLFSTGNKSAYDIYSWLKKTGNPMAYKNVHKRVKRLLFLGLIEEAEKFKRNAIKYRLTAYGLFQCLILESLDRRFDYVPAIVLDRQMKKESAVIRTILYQFFDEQTVRTILKSFFWSLMLQNYLRETCQATVRKVEEWRLDPPLVGSKTSAMNILITEKAKSFIYQLVVSSKQMKSQLNPKRNPLDSNLGGGNEALLNVIHELGKDEKFIDLLRVIKGEFYGGCKLFLRSD